MLLISGSPKVPIFSHVLPLCLSGNSYRLGTKLEQVQTYSRSEAGQEPRGSAGMPGGMAPGPWETLLPRLERTASDGSSPFGSSHLTLGEDPVKLPSCLCCTNQPKDQESAS